jgi:anaerobic ribonucleoside-triphosphate reductase activating protein
VAARATSPTSPAEGALRAAGELRVACFLPETEAEGPGKRAALWLQGCPLRCPGCCNPEMLPDQGGELRGVDELAAALEASQREHGIEGLTLLGGEPVAQAPAAARLAEAAQRLGLSVMLFSGYTRVALERRAAKGEAGLAELLAACDLLVDGPYLRELPERRRRWIGSRNQQLHRLSDRYAQDDARFVQDNTVELRLGADGTLTINGWPAGADGLGAAAAGAGAAPVAGALPGEEAAR